MSAQDLSFRALLPAAAGLYRARLPALFLACAAFALPCAAVGAFARRQGLSWLDTMQVRGALQLALGTVGSVLVARLLLTAARGERGGLWPSLAWALRRWPAGVTVALVTSLVVSAGLALLVLPGAVVALNLCMALPLLAATDLDANLVLRRAAALVLGKRRLLVPSLAFTWGVSALLSSLFELACERAAAALGPHPAVFAVDLAAEVLVGLCDAGLLAVLVVAYCRLVPAPESAPRPLAGRPPTLRA